MPYSVPGFADEVSENVLVAWNERIRRAFDEQGSLVDPYFTKRDPSEIPDGQSTAAVKWRGSPAEPRFCLGEEWAEKLSNWGLRARHQLHNEYLEFGVIMRPDSTGRLRPKRFVATTELREYWLTLAVADPEALARAARDVLGWTPAWREFYGSDIDDPSQLDAAQREARFILNVAGSGKSRTEPRQPVGSLNRENLLFMSHPINGLDDLIYVVAFGAQAYIVRQGDGFRRATLHEIFIYGEAEQLACRNADPAACAGAFDQVYKPAIETPTGCPVAFSDPIGMYIRSFRSTGLRYGDAPVPQAWIRKRRGSPGLEQRLEFGPGDDEDAFLDDVQVEEGEDTRPLVAGYELAKRIEVGPELTVGDDRQIPADKYLAIPAADRDLDCSAGGVCPSINQMKINYEANAPVGLRGSL
jgi:hypothetical protein